MLIFVLGIIQALLLLAAAPLLSGALRVFRAKMHSRQGPGVLQDYRDLLKLLRRQDVRPPAAGFVFRITPSVMLAGTLVIASALPIITATTPIIAIGDLFTLVYLLALLRFFFALCGLDSGSSYAGIGASREVTLGTLVEPVMVLSLVIVALMCGSTNIGNIGQSLAEGNVKAPIAALLAGFAFAYAAYFELSKSPYDMSEAEQEIMEGPLMEYSGPSLALIKLAISLKQLVMIALFLALFVPFGTTHSLATGTLLIAAVMFVLKVVVVALLVGIVENSMSRLRYKHTSWHTWFGMGLAMLAFVFYLIGL